MSRAANIAEQEVYKNAFKAIDSARDLVIADFPARDVDRLLTFLQVARDTKRKLAILPKDAYLLKTMRLLEPEIPDIAEESAIFLYQETTASRSPAQWLKKTYEEYSNKVVLAKDVASDQGAFILCFSFWDLNELPSIQPRPGSLYVFSSSEPHIRTSAMVTTTAVHQTSWGTARKRIPTCQIAYESGSTSTWYTRSLATNARIA